MNEDFGDNDSMDANSSDPSSINVEVQVRLMNLVIGEASDFERDQLQLLMEQRTEVADYFQHLKHLHGLLSEVGAGDPPPHPLAPSPQVRGEGEPGIDR